MLIIGVDPGHSTGIAIIEPKTRTLLLSETINDCNWRTVSTRLRAIKRLPSFFERAMDAVVENFHGGVGGKIQNEVNQIIGAVCTLLDTEKLVLQDNIKRMPWFDESTRILQQLEVKYTPHQRDALAHALSAAKLPRNLPWFLP